MPSEKEIRGLVLDSIAALNDERPNDAKVPVSDDMVLMGVGTLLDSLGLVTLIVDVEQRLQQIHDVSISLTDDRAMSHRTSPFRTVQTLTDYIRSLLEENDDSDST